MIGVAGLESRLGSNFELDAERALTPEVGFGRVLSGGRPWSAHLDFTDLSKAGRGVAATAVAGTARRWTAEGIVSGRIKRRIKEYSPITGMTRTKERTSEGRLTNDEEWMRVGRRFLFGELLVVVVVDSD
jgi:hypothetical protein